jgi:hypothetical protein
MPWPKLRKSLETESQNISQPKSRLQYADQRLVRLARRLDEIPAKDAVRIEQARQMERKQNAAGAELHNLCHSFVKRLNELLSNLEIEFTPEVFAPESLNVPNGLVFQINASGRIIQVTLSTRAAEVSTEHYRFPYILEGRIQWFNQELLERQEIQELEIFYCVDSAGDSWRYHDPRTRNGGRLNHEFLVQVLEQIV